MKEGKSSKFTYQDRISNERRAKMAEEIALERAADRLRREGLAYPQYDPEKTPDENYAALAAYRTKEANYVIEAMRMPSGPRPIEVFGNKWEPYK